LSSIFTIFNKFDNNISYLPPFLWLEPTALRQGNIPYDNKEILVRVRVRVRVGLGLGLG
jgi:hypothetical protein